MATVRQMQGEGPGQRRKIKHEVDEHAAHNSGGYEHVDHCSRAERTAHDGENKLAIRGGVNGHATRHRMQDTRGP